MDLKNIYILFWLYGVLGWCMETLLVSIKSKKFINRGFLLGPYCPIYGTGGVILLLLSSYKDDKLVVFILSIFICSLVEYLTSYIMEFIYNVRWWDYSNRMFNINGRICLFNSICFGLLGTLMVCFLNPFFISIINSLTYLVKNILLTLIFIITTTDMIITFTTMFDVKKTINDFKDKTLTNLFKPNTDQTEEISKKVRNILKEKGFVHKHLSKSYSDLKVYRNNFFKKKDELLKHRKIEKLENNFIIGTIISLIIGYLLGILFNNISLFMIISFVINIITIHILNRSKNGK